MDEQSVQQTASAPEQSATWDAAADGAAYSDYEDTAMSSIEAENDDFDETDDGGFDDFDNNIDGNDIDDFGDNSDDFNDNNNGQPSGLKPDGIGLDRDGNIQFGDNFFAKSPQNGTEQRAGYYTDDELRKIPFEQWDKSRLNGDINHFVPIVQEQLQARQSHAIAQNIQNTPLPSEITQVNPYTPKELSEAATQLACEKLGLEDPEDFDSFDPEHLAAMNIAMNELQEKRNSDIQSYNRGQAEWGQLQQFNAGLSQQPDFNEFNQWYMGKLQQAGVTAEQVNAGLYDYARKNGNRFSLIPQIIGAWYGEFQRERGGGKPQARRGRSNSSRRAGRPPVLESTRGNNYEGRRAVNLQNFGEMDDDEQANALMRMGIV